MSDIYIEDFLHLVQGVDKEVSLIKVECLNVNTTSDYSSSSSSGDTSGSIITVTSRVSLEYEIGFNIQLFIDSVFNKSIEPIRNTAELVDVISGGDFSLIPCQKNPSSQNHLFEIENPKILQELERIYPNIRDLAFRDNFMWLADEKHADKLMNEYQMALALKPFSHSCYLQESLRIGLHNSIIVRSMDLVCQ